jgi:WD40 repeat protein
MNPRTGKETQRGLGLPARIWAASFSPDGRTLLLFSGDLRVLQVDRTTNKILREYDVPMPEGPGQEVLQTLEGSPGPTAFSPDGKLLAYTSWQTGNVIVVLVDLGTRRIVHTVEAPGDMALALAFAPDSKTLAWASWKDRGLHLVEVATGRERHRLTDGHLGGCRALAFSADGRKLICGSDDSTALVWDLTGRLLLKERWAELLSAEEWQSCWADLAGKDAVRAFRAGRRLVGTPADSIRFLRGHLRPMPVADRGRVERLIIELDSDDFSKREKACQELEKLGYSARAFCEKALTHTTSAEVRRRLKAILERQGEGRWESESERLRCSRALEVLELIGDDEARQLLRSLAGGAVGAGLTVEARVSLERLDRSRRSR